MIRIIFAFAIIIAGLVSIFVILTKYQHSAPVDSGKKEESYVPTKWERAMSKALPDVLDKYKADIIQTASLFNVNPNIITAIVVVESMGDKYAVSTKGALGCMQTLPSTDVEIQMEENDSFDCPTSIMKGTKYLTFIHDRYGITDLNRIIVAYSDGPNRVKKYTDEKVRDREYLWKVNMVMKKIPIGTFDMSS